MASGSGSLSLWGHTLFGHLCILTCSDTPQLVSQVTCRLLGQQAACLNSGTLAVKTAPVQCSPDLFSERRSAAEVEKHRLKAVLAVEDVNEAGRTSVPLCLPTFTCLFNQRPRQEAGPRNTQLWRLHGNANVNCGTSTPRLLSAKERGGYL